MGSVLLGVFAAVLVALGSLALALSQPVRWSATSSLVVLPAPEVDPSSAAGFYETLSRGQIPATFAQLIRLQRFESAAADSLDLSNVQREDVNLDVELVPDTAVVNLTLTAPGPALAEAMADGIVAEANRYVAGLSGPFTLAVIDRASGSAERSAQPILGFLLAGTLAGAAIGLAVQQAIVGLAKIVSSSVRVRDETPSAEPDYPLEEETRQEVQARPEVIVEEAPPDEDLHPVLTISDADSHSLDPLVEEGWLDDLRRLREEISSEATELLTKAAARERRHAVPSSPHGQDGSAHDGAETQS